MAITKINAIGVNAINEEAILILFGPSVTEDLAKYSIEQTMPDQEVTLKPGSEIRFGEQIYLVKKVGEVANQNLNEIGHASILFDATTDIANGIYVTPAKMPTLTVGMEIEFN